MKQDRTSTYRSGMRCTESDLLGPSAACPFCEFPEERQPALQLQQSPDVQLLLCPSCGGASASRMPKSETLARYYGEYYSEHAEKVTFDGPLRFARHLVGLVPQFPQQQLRILDFGGGGGALSTAAAKLLIHGGARTVHIDIVDYHEPSPSSTGGIVIRHARSIAELSSTRYELVLASAIVEHLPAPRLDLIRLYSAIAPGGFFYVRTPWMLPVMQLLAKGGFSIDFAYPGHLHDLGRNFWNRILGHLPLETAAYHLRHSAPSIVETGFSEAPLLTLAAYALKFPSRLFPSWPLVGGWEVVFERTRE